MLTAILGLQWGDEGKGKLVDNLGQTADVVARYCGGANAGHTIWVGGRKFVTHQLPSGILSSGTRNVVGNGCVVHLPALAREIAEFETAGVDVRSRLAISSRATLLLDYHRELDAAKETRLGEHAVGTTRSGIGPAYAEKVSRDAFRVADILDFATFEERLRARFAEVAAALGQPLDIDGEVARYRELAGLIGPLVTDTAALLQDALAAGQHVIAEGAQAALLDIDHGTYPFVTSSSTSIGGVFTGLGVPPPRDLRLVGVAKAYTTRVGSGPFPTELADATGEMLRQTGHEFGATTGRPRRTGWCDLVATRYAARLDGVTELNLTKLDVLNDLAEIQLCTGYTLDGRPLDTLPPTAAELARIVPVYETLPGWQADTGAIRRIADLPPAALRYVRRVEEVVGVPVRWVGVGTDREALAGT